MTKIIQQNAANFRENKIYMKPESHYSADIEKSSILRGHQHSLLQPLKKSYRDMSKNSPKIGEQRTGRQQQKTLRIVQLHAKYHLGM